MNVPPPIKTYPAISMEFSGSKPKQELGILNFIKAVVKINIPKIKKAREIIPTIIAKNVIIDFVKH